MSDDDLDFEFNLVGDDDVEEEADVGAIKDNLQAGDWAQAAMIFELAPAGTAKVLLEEITSDDAANPDTIENAAKMFAEARDFGSAGSAFQQAGDLQGAAEQYARQANYWEAAKLYRELGDSHQEVGMLQQVPQSSPDRLAAVDRLSDLMVEHGYLADAAQLLTDTMRELHNKDAGIDLATKLVPLLVRLDKHDEARAVQSWLDQQAPTLEPIAEEEPPAPPAAEDISPVSAQTPIEHLAGFSPAPKKKRNPMAYRTLKSIPMFAELSIVDMKDLYKQCEERAFAVGESLLTKGEPGKGLFAIVEGRANVSNNGRQLNVAAEGDYVGEMGLVRDQPASADVAAMTDLTALFIERSRFETFLRSRPDAAARIWRLFCHNLAERVAHLSE
jgi:tetratricopeptide (TPR) repeat protein